MNTGRAGRRLEASSCSPPSRGRSAASRVRARRRRLHRRRGGRLAPRRAGIIKSSADVEAARQHRARQRRRVVRARVHRPRRPDWDPYARGAIIGITRGTTAAHLPARRSTASRCRWPTWLDAHAAATLGQSLSELRVDGGASVNDTLLQFQADVLQTPRRAAEGHRNDGARRRVPGRPRDRRLEGSRRNRRPWQVDRRFEPNDAGRRARPRCGPAGTRRSSGRSTGPSRSSVGRERVDTEHQFSPRGN